MLIDARIKRLTDDLQRVSHDMNILKEEIGQILKLKDKKVRNYFRYWEFCSI